MVYFWQRAIKSIQSVDPRSFAVIGANGTFRQSSFDSGFNPTGTEPPFFQIFDPDFLKVHSFFDALSMLIHAWIKGSG
jgi:hypothetical protein